MMAARVFTILLCFFFTKIASSQSVNIEGVVHGTADLEGVHVINKTSKRATITDVLGKFSIKIQKNDTLVFSGIQYKLESILVNQQIIDARFVSVYLEENINELDEVVVGNVLTGDLNSDIENTDVKLDINFYDVGIPGYKGKIKTQSERRVVEADHGKFMYYYGIGVVINVNKVLNRVSGRTKELKNRVELETRDELMFKLKAKFSKDLFSESPLKDALRYEFFYYCSEDPDFIKKCGGYNDLEAMSFLQEKLITYQANLKN